MGECRGDVAVAGWVCLAYGLVYFLILILVSILSYRTVKHRDDSEMSDYPLTMRFTLWLQGCYRLRGCYIPLIRHFIDEASDYAMIVEYYFIWKRQISDPSFCYEVNALTFFIISCCITMGYRVISSSLMWYYTRSLRKSILQMFDFELFNCLLVNYQLGRHKPCNPQRWIQGLEAIFEAAPHALLHLVFLLDTKTSNNPIIIFSLVMSFLSVISRLMTDDRILYKRQYTEMRFNVACDNMTQFKCVSHYYLLRLLFRAADFTQRLAISCLLWLLFGGLFLFIALSIDFAILIFFSLKYNQIELMKGMISTIATRSRSERLVSWYLYIFRTIVSVGLLIAVSIKVVTSHTHRWLIMPTIGGWISATITIGLAQYFLFDQRKFKDSGELIESGDGKNEIPLDSPQQPTGKPITTQARSNTSDEKEEMDMDMDMGVDMGMGVDMDRDEIESRVVVPASHDWHSLFQARAVSDIEELLVFGFRSSQLDKSGCGFLHWSVSCGDPEILHRLVQCNYDVSRYVNIGDNDGRSPLHYAVMASKPNFIEGLLNFNADINLTDNNGMTPLHLAATRSDMELIHRLVELGANIEAIDEGGRNILHHCREGSQTGEDMEGILCRKYPVLAAKRMTQVGSEIMPSRESFVIPEEDEDKQSPAFQSIDVMSQVTSMDLGDLERRRSSL